MPMTTARDAGVYDLGRRLAAELVAAYGPRPAGLPEAHRLLAAADPDLVPLGERFLAGLRSGVTKTAAGGDVQTVAEAAA